MHRRHAMRSFFLNNYSREWIPSVGLHGLSEWKEGCRAGLGVVTPDPPCIIIAVPGIHAVTQAINLHSHYSHVCVCVIP